MASLLAVLALPAFAESNTKDALEQTQQLLIDPANRDEVIRGNADAKNTDKALNDLVGNRVEQQRVYELAADILGSIVTKSEGDPQKMDKLLEDAKKNPEAFANTFTPEQKKTLSDIAAKTPGKLP